MRLLIFTQKVDRDDAVLGFFHTWITEISKMSESVEVICLEKGNYDLPKNVTVYAVGKGIGFGKLKYITGVYKYLFLIRGSYDRVFVHMNQEYVFSLGPYWKIMGIPVYLWRNHPDGSIFTTLAVALSTKVFCASTESFTARFKKTVIMPAGINTEKYKHVTGAFRKKYSVCVVGRISPIKHVDLAIEAIKVLVSEGVQVSLDIVGPVPALDQKYFESLEKMVANSSLSTVVRFLPAVNPDKISETYSGYEICLNLTDSGSFDKTIVESASCGAVPLVSNTSFKNLLPSVCLTTQDPESIARSIKTLLDPSEQIKIQKDLKNFVDSQSLEKLMQKFKEEIK